MANSEVQPTGFTPAELAALDEDLSHVGGVRQVFELPDIKISGTYVLPDGFSPAEAAAYNQKEVEKLSP